MFVKDVIDMKVSSTEVQNNFGKYLKIASELEDVIVTRNGREIAMIMPCQERVKVAEEAASYIFNGKYKLSYEEFLEMIEKSDLRYEYIDGEVYCLASPVYNHQVVVDEIYVNLYNWLKGKKCRPLTSPFDITLKKSRDNINVVQPDIIVICDTDNIEKSGKYKGVPTLVVEALSNSTRSRDILKKLDLYMQTGVKEYWVADPAKRELILYSFYKHDIKDYEILTGKSIVKSKVLEGLEIKLENIFTE
jgi:prevent-host-death family protein